MNGFFSIIGSIASLVSVPLAIYLYLKSREAKFDRLKKEIAKVLSYQIGDERQLSTFEIRTVINSKLWENNISTDSVSVSEIIEDLVSETISSPLIGKERKAEILGNLKKIYFKGELFEEIDSISEVEINNWEIIEPKFKNILKHQYEFDDKLKEIKEYRDKYKQRLSTIFALSAFLMTILTMTIIVVGQETFLEWNERLNEPIREYEFIISIILGSLASIIAGIATFIFKKKTSKS